MSVYITDVWLEGFQSHKQTHVRLEPGFNAIIGPTNSGKSAIMRAIRFILYNVVEDSNFVTFGQDKFSGTIAFSNGKTVTRERNKNENRYILTEADGTIVYEGAAFGKGPVPEVLEFHGMYPIQLGADSYFLNMQEQLEPPFFLGSTAAERANFIGSMANTGLIDEAIKFASTELTVSKRSKKELDLQIKEEQTRLKLYEDVPAREADLKTVKQLYEAAKKEHIQYETLCRTEDVLFKESPVFFRCRQRLALIPHLNALEQIVADLTKQEQNYSLLQSRAASLTESFAAYLRSLQTTKRFPASAVSKIEALLGELDDLKQRQQTLQTGEIVGNERKQWIANKSIAERNLSALDQVEQILRETTLMQQTEETMQQTWYQFHKELEAYFQAGDIAWRSGNARDRAEEALDAFLLENPICPTCGGEIRKENLI